MRNQIALALLAGTEGNLLPVANFLLQALAVQLHFRALGKEWCNLCCAQLCGLLHNQVHPLTADTPIARCSLRGDCRFISRCSRTLAVTLFLLTWVSSAAYSPPSPLNRVMACPAFIRSAEERCRAALPSRTTLLSQLNGWAV